MSENGHVQLELAREEGFHLQADFELLPRGITVLFGPSGCGKTTLLRCVAGLTRAKGVVSVAGELWQDDAQNIFVPTHRRSLGYVFQESSLFDHLSASGNIEFARKRARHPMSAARLAELTEVLGLESILDKRPASLSGGERQRVAIVRALAQQPSILLMDEPLSALDAARKAEFLPWLERLRDELAIPVLYVTHSEEEMHRLADRILLLESGRMTAFGTPTEVLFEQSRSGRSANAGVLLEAVLKAQLPEWGSSLLACRGLTFEVPWLIGRTREHIRVSIGAKDVSIARERVTASSIRNIFPARIDEITPLEGKSSVLVTLTAGGERILSMISARSAAELALEPGESVFAQVKAVSLAN